MSEQELKIKDINLSYFTNNENVKHIWMQRDDGEGLGISIDDFYKLIDDFFNYKM